MSRVIVAGVGMVPFRKPGQSDAYDVMAANATRMALADAGIGYSDVQQAYAGYVHADSCAGQTALYHVGITGIPIYNVNNNCSSGSSAFALAAQAVAGGSVECALAVGFEQMDRGAIDLAFPHKTSPFARHHAALRDAHGLSDDEMKLPPALSMFGCQVEAIEALGVTAETLAGIAVKSRNHAAKSPYAIFREPLTVADILDTPPIFRTMRRLYACPPSCGAAAVIVCSESFARRHGLRSDVALVGQGISSDLSSGLAGGVMDIMLQSLSEQAARQAYESAGVGPEEIDVIELHDCFTSNEASTYVALGLCKTEDINQFVADGQNTYGGKYVICPSGGLLAKGHPLGATGLAQITELTWQLRGQAGERQVDDVRTVLQHNVGLGSAGFVHIFQRL
ncbi:thiolase C-terminal domain-containing protein [Povalibacter sp.]|uniref:thiolase C-terminal domain-containing protein n=1 Tax=Povalibacter sp. TaxID=1962978 RepID=UPI002F4234DC